MKRRSIMNLILAMALCLFLAPATLAGSGEPFLGVLLQDLDDDLRKHFDFKGEGIMINDVIEGTGADRSDLKREDIITAIGDQKIASVDDVKKAISTAALGEKVAITVFRDQEVKTIPVEISDKTESVWDNARKWVYFPKDDRPWVGVSLEDLNSQLAKYFGTKSGVLIKEVFKDSPAKKAKLRAGDVIISWNGETVENTVQLFKRLDVSNPEDTIRLTVMRKDKKRKVRLVLGQPNPEAAKLYGLSKKGHHSEEDGIKGDHHGMGKLKLPMIHLKSAQKGSEHTDARIEELEEKIQDLTGELRRLVETLDTKSNEEDNEK